MLRQAKVVISDAYKLASLMRQEPGDKGHLARTICHNINYRFPELTNYVGKEGKDGKKKASKKKDKK